MRNVDSHLDKPMLLESDMYDKRSLECDLPYVFMIDQPVYK